ncbi:hypothetical protein MPSEU_000913100 [Mayamaea pseudoterrestris]|nr:hypothetical protein MPSEU_000913100 [Mayamaea pseudoterrestris]
MVLESALPLRQLSKPGLPLVSMIVQYRRNLVGRIAALAFLTSKRYIVSAFAFSPKNKTILDRMLSSTDVLQQSHLIHWEHIKIPIQSTQDEARRLLHERAATVDVAVDPQGDQPSTLQPFLAVLADVQRQGRGTQGRHWEGGQGNETGNMYLTICIPYDEIPVQLTLLPLQIAVLIAERAKQMLDACDTMGDDSHAKTPLSKVTVKWPNDVLIDDCKLSGTLIENEIVNNKTWFLIGIGVNVAFAPDLSQSPGRSIRPATCLQEHCRKSLPSTAAAVLASDLAHALVDWVMDKAGDKQLREQKVIDRWKSFAEFGTRYVLRGDVENEENGSHSGEEVVTVDIQSDGQLRVQGENGCERLLIAEYLF